ncbi:aminodeoxychorismate lyase [Siminovitchia sp. FSL H7-0308]|uniref:aminodeoxychorismate lyase n=1 Tax=Siminovitchia sp. FSL H7-0308 TaxID=2921432 RepID=UPI0030EB5786
MVLFLNGKFIKKENAVISPFDHGYLYGLGVFETIRTYGGKPFLLEEHIERLNHGLEELEIDRSFTSGEVKPIIQELCLINGLPDSYIRMNVSAGEGDIGLQTAPYIDPTVIIFQKSLPPLIPLQEKEAVILKLRRNTPETEIRMKSHHFFNNAAAKRELGPDRDREGIFLTREGYLAEGITSNLFWVKAGVLYTPSLETGILNGITRQLILKLARSADIPVIEGLFKENVLQEADEIFFTNSIQEIVPVHKFMKCKLPGNKGVIVGRLYEKYKDAISKMDK